MKRQLPILAMAVVLVAVGLSWWTDEDALPSARPVGPSRSGIPAATGRSQANPPSVAAAASQVAPAAAAPESVDQEACDAATQAGKSDAEPRLPALRLWSQRLAQEMAASGSSVDLALGSLIGKTADWNVDQLAVQVGAVARAALVTTDPLLYKLALRACYRMQDSDTYVPGAESCASLNHTQLVRLDPENVQLWMEETVTARLHGDRAAELDALYHASRATEFGSTLKPAVQDVVQSIGGTAPPWVRYALLHELLNELALSAPRADLLNARDRTDSCADGAVADQNVRQLCDDLAHNLLDRSNNPDTLWSGILLGKQLGWPNDRLEPFYRRVWHVYLAKERLPTVAESACGNASYGLAVLAAITAPDPLSALRSDIIQGGMSSILKSREAAREAEPASEEGDADEAESEGSTDR